MTERIRLGRTDIEVAPVGAGTWQWGDRFYWGYGREYGEEDVADAFRASVEAGVNFFDSAEMYGRGQSERLLAGFMKSSRTPVVIGTKFMPSPWRLRARDLLGALRGSLKRLALEKVDLYQVHWPLQPRSVETWARALADAVDAGMARAVGVSNYNVDQMRRAHEVLERRGVPLASNQVAFSLLDRRRERSGLLAACRDLGVTLIAYSPLAQGLLTGKYSPERRPPLVRRLWTLRGRPRTRPENIEALLGLMQEVGEDHGGKTQAQVALNWLVCKGALPIPGAKNAGQARSNAGALGWRLAREEVALLDEVSALAGSTGRLTR